MVLCFIDKGSMIPVKVISSSDLEENGGVYLVKKGVPAVPVHGFTTQGNKAVSSRAMPVYVVSQSEFDAGDFVKAHGQPFQVGDIDDLGFVGVVGGREAMPVYAVNDWPLSDDVPLDADYLVYEGAMAVAPSVAWRTAANQLFISWKAALSVSSLSSAMDIAYIFAAETEQAALLNMVKRAHDCTKVNAVAFVASRGFTGNGTTSYLNTNYNPSTQGVRYVLNSACLGVYSRTDIQASVCDIGARVGLTDRLAWINSRQSTNIMSCNVNQGSQSTTGSSPTSLGLFIGNRNGSGTSNLKMYRNAVAATGNQASTTIPSLNFFICGRNNNGSMSAPTTRQYSFALAGRSMSDAEHLATYNAVQTFLTTIGAQV